MIDEDGWRALTDSVERGLAIDDENLRLEGAELSGPVLSPSK